MVEKIIKSHVNFVLYLMSFHFTVYFLFSFCQYVSDWNSIFLENSREAEEMMREFVKRGQKSHIQAEMLQITEVRLWHILILHCHMPVPTLRIFVWIHVVLSSLLISGSGCDVGSCQNPEHWEAEVSFPYCILCQIWAIYLVQWIQFNVIQRFAFYSITMLVVV